jgi:plastocyanin
MRLVFLVLVGFVVVSVLAIGSMMAAMGMNGHMGMMGGRGSDPDDVVPLSSVTDVRLQDFAFEPANIVVDVGTTVTWTNEDSADHTVTSDDGDEMDSPRLGENETFSRTFDQPGEYRYHCDPHPNMRGLVTVRDS